ncbi:MAG: dTDP-4-dehydrorhamnose 3,5-epimerase [Crocinitomicaceae bacterium]|nr:dTDP-4-dehydrorhamnose 3,5-epimerase [Crocinitomicaceae bacterium]
MEITRYHIENIFSYVPRTFKDDRGSFFESFNHKLFCDAAGRKVDFVQDNQSSSIQGVVRGLHFQNPPHAQGKLVRVLKGKVLDVAVDLRKNSATYGQHIAVELSADNNRVLWIPEGFAHGFSVLENETVFFYKCTSFYHKESEQTIAWNDSQLNIDWQIENPVLSEKDQVGLAFENFISPF